MSPLSLRHRPLLVIVGPTAVGKTALSLALAQQHPLAIVSADSRLFYRGMDIGTAKPSAEEQASVEHFLIDICDPDESVSLGMFQDMAYAAIDGVLATGRLPVLVGGTGQYVRAVVEGWGIPRVPPQPALRDALAALGKDELARWLQQLDPDSAARIDARNVRRVIRALEIALVSGQTMTELQTKSPPNFAVKQIGLIAPRETLFERIDTRVDAMMEAGFLAEMQALIEQGYTRDLSSMSGLGYRQLWAFFRGESTLAEAVERIKFETHRFVRQQANWFRQDDASIDWFDITDADYPANARTAVADWLAQLKQTA